MSFAVMGTGSYVPPRVVTNEELSQFVDTTDEWITQRVGVKQRYVCTTETAADLGAEAARRALALEPDSDRLRGNVALLEKLAD